MAIVVIAALFKRRLTSSRARVALACVAGLIAAMMYIAATALAFQDPVPFVVGPVIFAVLTVVHAVRTSALAYLAGYGTYMAFLIVRIA